MRSTPVSKLKASLSEHLDAVRRGEEIIVTDRGRPIARIVPIEGVGAADARLSRLIREGTIAPPKSRRKERWKPPPGKKPTGALAALLAERAEGR